MFRDHSLWHSRAYSSKRAQQIGGDVGSTGIQLGYEHLQVLCQLLIIFKDMLAYYMDPCNSRAYLLYQ
jgi:hypothetical protein